MTVARKIGSAQPDKLTRGDSIRGVIGALTALIAISLVASPRLPGHGVGPQIAALLRGHRTLLCNGEIEIRRDAGCASYRDVPADIGRILLPNRSAWRALTGHGSPRQVSNTVLSVRCPMADMRLSGIYLADNSSPLGDNRSVNIIVCRYSYRYSALGKTSLEHIVFVG